MELKDAYGIMGKADALFEKLSAQYDSMRGASPVGQEGAPAYDTLEQVLEHVKLRRVQILRLRESIALLTSRRESNTAAIELREIAEELKL
jgi:hypothetical protein